MNKFISSIAMFCLLLLLAACVRNPVTGKKQFGVMSFENEVAMGQAYDPQIVAQFGLYEDATLQAYINQKGKQMAAISHRPELPYDFKIVDSPVVNAFAVPGGFVYFTRGIMAHFNNEAEFAGVLGHEIGHITARHSVKQQRDAQLMQVGLVAGMIAKPELAQFAGSASQGLQLLMLKFGRDAESQSDELGVEYSSKIGYDAHEMANFFETLARKSQAAGVSIPEFMSTHPDPLNRKQRVGEMAGEWQTKLNLNDAQVGRNKYLSMLNGLVYGEDPRQGFVENNKFYHPELAFEFPVPAGWQHQNSPQAFQMAAADGKGANTLTAGPAGVLSEQISAIVQQYDLDVISSQPKTIHGNQAHTVIARTKPATTTDGQTQAQDLVMANITMIKYGNLTYTFTAVSLEADFNALQPSFNTTINNFKKLTDADKLSRQPEIIKVVTVNKGATFASHMATYGIPGSRHEELAVVNGMMVGDQVPSGTKLKVVETRKAN